jgi:hypothetical protein
MSLIRRMGNLFHRSRMDREIDAELQAHIALRTDDNLASGMAPEEAHRDALMRFGNPTSTREHVAATEAALGLDSFWFDVRYAFRQLRRSPGFTLTAVAIGGNAVVFSVLNALVLRPLNLSGAERLYTIEQRGEPMNSYPDFRDLRDRNRTFDDIAVYNFESVGLDTGGNPQQTWIYEARNCPSATGGKASRGRRCFPTCIPERRALRLIF